MTMNQFNMTENGCSLEDCHTNLFALTDLTGIKWQRLSAQTDACMVDPTEDPVLVSYSKCIQSDILCVWRRQPRTDKPPDQLMSNPKELWIFWYGQDPPANLSSLLSPELVETESGSWESGLTYECRTLLFKALHNLIERCLLSHNFVRVGKWFVQPCGQPEGRYETRANLSISFLFFLHGESTVCASIDVRQHPPLYGLHASHVTVASQYSQGVQVLLAPYGMSGSLTGRSFAESDQRAQKMLDDWKRFFCFPKAENQGGLEEGKELPAAVEVIVAGMRLCYPSCFVFLTGETLDLLSRNHSSLCEGGGAPDGIGAAQSSSSFSGSSTSSGPPPDLNAKVKSAAGQAGKLLAKTEVFSKKVLAQRVIEKAWQDSTLTSGLVTNSRNQTDAMDSIGGGGGGGSGIKEEASSSVVWNFSEPMQKNPCICAKTKSMKMKAGMSDLLNKQQGGFLSSGRPSKGEKSDKTDKDRPRHLQRSFAPYHRRSVCQDVDSTTALEMDFALPQNLSSNSLKLSTSAAAEPSLPFGRGSSGTGSGGQVGTADSPHSGVPSPLISSQTQPSVNQNCDPTMPTLSPHPLPSKSERDAGQSTRVKDCQDLNASCGSSSTASSMVLSAGDYDGVKGLSTTATDKLEKQTSVVGGIGGAADGSGDLEDQTMKLTLGGVRQMKKEAFKTWQEDQAEKLAKFTLLKRPNLPLLFEDEDAEETKTGMMRLYDYPPDSVMDQPSKRMRSSDHLDNPSSSESPIDLFGHDKVAAAAMMRNAPGHLFARQGMRGGGDLPSPSMHGVPMNEDPYQFSDEVDSNVKNMNLHAVRSASRDEGFPTKPTTFRQDDQYRARGTDGGYDNDEYRMSMEFSPSPTSKAEQTTKLMTDDDLKPKIQDLEKMFDTDEECDADSPASPEKPNGDVIASSVFPKISPSLGITGSSVYPAIQGPTSKDLSRMFPTPPSADNPSSEPMQDADFMTDTAYLAMGSADPSGHQHLYSNSYHLVPKEEAVKHSATICAASIRKDCPFVYKVPALSIFPTATIYDPIDLPSNHVDPLTSASRLIYSSSYQPQHPTDKLSPPVSNQYLNRHLGKSVVSISGYPGSSRNPGASVDSSPAMLGPPLTQQRTPRTPMSYESPASTSSSSCFNKNLSSMDNMAHSAGGGAGQTPEVSSLAVNVLLMDSILNVFKDLNFDSCTICVCNANIDGNDIGLYLPDRPKEEMYRCYCAFSAIINRRHGFNSGLFYEDEVDITNCRHGYFDARKRSLLQVPSVVMSSGDKPDLKGLQGSAARDDVEHISQDIMMLLKDQFSTLYPSCAVLASHQSSEPTPLAPEWGSLEFFDGQDACYAALEFGRLMSADICSQSHIDKSSPCLHRWPYGQSMAKISKNSQDIVRLLKSLQPLLQDALQKKRTTKLWESVYNISGPLSWKDFHLMAGRGSEETSEPKPVPNVLVGFGKEWMALSPHALRYWDKLMLEPYSEPRNVLYVIVSPDNDYVLSQAAVFVRELGVMYEQCRMGEHKPLTEKLRDGVLRIGKTNAERVASEPVDDWFRDIGNSQTAAQLRLYSQVCRRLLANLISQHLPEKSAASEEASNRSAQYQQFQQHQQQASEAGSFQAASASSLPPSSSSLSSGGAAPTGGTAGPGDHHLHGSLFDAPSSEACFNQPQQQQQQDSEIDHSDGSFLGGGAGGRGASGSGEGPFVVLYLIEPFTYGQRDTDLSRLAMFGILRCYHDLLRLLPEQMQRRVQLQIIPQHVLLDFDHVTGSQFLKNICFSVYANCHRVLTKSIPGRSLTGFGTAAACEKFLQDHKQLTGEVSSVQLYTPPFILAPSPSAALSLGGGADSWTDPVDRSGVLFCAYCLSEDQRWLLVSCTDSGGELLETCCINIEVPKRRHRKKPQVARTGLLKLWDFLLGVMSNTNQPWRVVIGRFGRLGHGELQAWSNILNRKKLQQCSQKLRNICKMCGILQSSQIPCILSACLVSMELHPSLHIMIDSVKREENQSSKCQMTTPRDASATHILVFPTSASARSHDPSINLPENHMEFADDDILSVFNSDDIGDDIGGDIDEFINFPFAPNSPKNPSAPGSPMNDGKQFGGGEPNRDHSASLTCDLDEVNSQHLLLQQPLAMGFYISTAPTGPLPKWFWSSCPERENFCPSCFKAALHIHCSSVQQNQDDPLHQPHQPHHSKHSHPLDSNVTTDVLRYVLETYNQLSWLTMDPITNDRRSCLPVHILVLMQLYHGIDRYV